MLKSSEILMDLKIFVTYKKRYYDLLGLVFSGICYNEKDENGNALAYLNEAKKQFEDFKKLSKIQKKEAIEKQVEWIEKFIKKNFDKFEQQNKLVYHDKIPDVLPGLISERNVGQVHPFQYPNASSKWTFEIYDSLNLPNYKMENEKIESEHQEEITSSDANEKLIKKETKKSEDSTDGIGGCGICEIL
jgi:membrane-associated HD superfamily phosphohydrolase